MEGIVKWFNEAEGYGFIEQEGDRDVFVHYSSIVTSGFNTLSDGDQVRFDIKETEKGLMAINIIIC